MTLDNEDTNSINLVLGDIELTEDEIHQAVLRHRADFEALGDDELKAVVGMLVVAFQDGFKRGASAVIAGLISAGVQVGPVTFGGSLAQSEIDSDRGQA